MESTCILKDIFGTDRILRDIFNDLIGKQAFANPEFVLYTKGSTLNSGACLPGHQYEIITTETDHFFAGCVIGDVFMDTAGIALDASNTVKEWTIDDWDLSGTAITAVDYCILCDADGAIDKATDIPTKIILSGANIIIVQVLSASTEYYLTVQLDALTGTCTLAVGDLSDTLITTTPGFKSGFLTTTTPPFGDVIGVVFTGDILIIDHFRAYPVV